MHGRLYFSRSSPNGNNVSTRHSTFTVVHISSFVRRMAAEFGPLMWFPEQRVSCLGKHPTPVKQLFILGVVIRQRPVPRAAMSRIRYSRFLMRIRNYSSTGNRCHRLFSFPVAFTCRAGVDVSVNSAGVRFFWHHTEYKVSRTCDDQMYTNQLIETTRLNIVMYRYRLYTGGFPLMGKSSMCMMCLKYRIIDVY